MKKHAKKRRGKRVGLFILFMVVLCSFSITYFFFLYDQKLMPSVLSVTELVAQTKINEAINQSLSETLSIDRFSSSDFFDTQLNGEGGVETISVNTVLINEICGKLAVAISNRLMSIKQQDVKIPMGTLLGVSALSNIGPNYSVSILPMGSAVVDYNSSFESIGINQVNFQIWLNVSTNVRIVNPLQNDRINVSRKLPLVNTVLSGKIPEVFLPGLNLTRED